MVDSKYQVVKINNKLTMKRILSEVSVKELDGCLKKVMELVEHKQLGHYYLHELGQFLSEVPAKVLYQKWLNELSSHFIWKQAEEHFKKTKQLWYNEPAWPFQICVLEIGGLSKEVLRKKWFQKYEGFYHEGPLTKHIDDFDLPTETKKRKIYLIRLQLKYLGVSAETTFSQVNCGHPEFNLSLCPPETAFFVRPLVKEYSDQKPTIFAADFKPASTSGDEKRVFYFCGYDLYMGTLDIEPNNAYETSNYWVFQYNQTYKNRIDDL